MKPQNKNTPHKEECCRRWHKNQKTEEKDKEPRKVSPINKEVESTLQNMSKDLEEKNQKLKLLEEANSELNKKLIEFEVLLDNMNKVLNFK